MKKRRNRVFPANAGMILQISKEALEVKGVPRECGDDPYTQAIPTGNGWCSPRMRG